ncbi:hypothetical protein PVK64_17900 [Aliivibrio sp. S4TY2]|uniref:hypothetical protein n=1 Tax=unclassified Aliivibrio TaxID=2645654 RepID=UPI002379B226|nr:MULTISPECIES: hypothetical protein [unclassified Aliivibrio]MDD9158040.1 hypothetical protein [Aliivibrio sp. S4TY2]MDD9161917.1 hypothetical protein [Aliivibrio sp. S4TY1]MDD9166037.1 hypothetical protein [Aliivibrio sp. S4MY2]MDD9169997.1 hypothetical protein [Aliivibrio sp. S4MY4]MDD9187048.1 hypothetical protein [Aliivibrio sp. S4MY3]
MDTYFQDILKIVMHAGVDDQFIDNLTIRDLIKLARREEMYNRHKINPEDYESGSEYVDIKKRLIDKLGTKPSKEVVSTVFNENYFSGIEIDGLTPWQKAVLDKVAQAEVDGDLQVKSMVSQFSRMFDKDGDGHLNDTEIDISKPTIELLKHLINDDGISLSDFLNKMKSVDDKDMYQDWKEKQKPKETSVSIKESKIMPMWKFIKTDWRNS